MQTDELYFLLKPFCELHEVRGRTTAQKIFYLLQSHGYPTQLDYFLHYYGPYSEDLSSFLRYASTSEPPLLVEHALQVGTDAMRFDYAATQQARELICAFEEKALSDEASATADRFCAVARSLNSKPAVDLELAATILYFEKERGCDRNKAIVKTREMKAKKADEAHTHAAEQILQTVREQSQ